MSKILIVIAILLYVGVSTMDYNDMTDNHEKNNEAIAKVMSYDGQIR